MVLREVTGSPVKWSLVIDVNAASRCMSGENDPEPVVNAGFCEGRGGAVNRQILWFNGRNQGEIDMEKTLRNPLFLTGLPLAVCGVAITAPGLWIPGLALMLCGWAKSSKKA